ncbi:hypothetical protein BLOT_007150, partial [Blomia tropicalis]
NFGDIFIYIVSDVCKQYSRMWCQMIRINDNEQSIETSSNVKMIAILNNKVSFETIPNATMVSVSFERIEQIQQSIINCLRLSPTPLPSQWIVAHSMYFGNSTIKVLFK